MRASLHPKSIHTFARPSALLRATGVRVEGVRVEGVRERG